MISHPHRCIFVHIPKCAGQSVEHLFLDALGHDWDSRAILSLGFNNDPALGPPRLAHLKASEYVDLGYVSQETFDDYFKFAIVRNPWARLVSMYKYLGLHLRRDFRDFVLSDLERKYLPKMRWFAGPQTDFVVDEANNLLVDIIVRFEQLDEGFEPVARAVGLPNASLPHVNPSSDILPQFGLRPKQLARFALRQVKDRSIAHHSNYRDYYDNETRDAVARIYHSDIEIFGYVFDEHKPTSTP